MSCESHVFLPSNLYTEVEAQPIDALLTMNPRQSKRGRQPPHRMSPRSSQRSEHTAPLEGVYTNPIMTHALTTLLGCVVDVQLQSGLVYEGILRTLSPQMDIVLEVAHIKTSVSGLPTRENVEKTLQLKLEQIVSFSAKEDVNPSMKRKEIFKTDSEINHSNGPAASRELQPFTDFEEGSGGLSLGTGEDEGWGVEEMWSVNKEKFQVTSNFDENMSEYTTDLARSNREDFKLRELRAAQLAMEIETGDKDRHGVSDAGTEEEVFSAVVRPPVAEPPPVRPPVAEPPPVRPPVAEPPPVRPPVAEPPPVRPPVAEPPPVRPPVAEPPPVRPPAVEPSAPRVPEESEGHLPANEQPAATQGKESSVTMATEGDSGESGTAGDREEAISEPASDPPADSEEHCQSQSEEIQPVPEGGAQDTGDKDAIPVPSPVPRDGGSGDAQPEPVADKKEEAIRKFKLDPNAKEFNPLSFDTVPATATAVTTQASPSPPVSSTSSSLRSSPSALHHRSGNARSVYTGHKSPRPRTHTPTGTPTFISQDSLLFSSAPVSSGYIITQPVVSSGIIRPLAQVPVPRQMMYASPQYTHVPAGSGFVGQGVLASPQMVSPKFDFPSTVPQPQVIVAGQQPPLAAVHQQQLIAQGLQGGIYPSSQGIMSVPQQQMMYMQGVPLQPALAMQAAAGGFVPGPHMAGTALPQNRIAAYSHYHHTTSK